MNKRGLVGVIVVAGILIIAGFFWFIGELNSKDEETRNCVPASCCHAASCVWDDNAPDCNGTFCTMSCEPGTMDCGAGHCGIVDGECGVIWDE